MQIKEAAARSALTERAVRLYEERGLISPNIENKNGRDFRDYSDHDLEQLKTISALRRALFTIDEIKVMLDDPKTIAQTLEKNRRRMHEDFAQLSYLTSRLDAVDGELAADARELSCALFGTETESAPPVDGSAEYELYSAQYRRIYDKYFAENTGWDMRYSAGLGVSGVFASVRRFFSRQPTRVILAVLFVAALTLAIVPNIYHVEKISYTFSGNIYDLAYDKEGDVTTAGDGSPLTLRFSGKSARNPFRAPAFNGGIDVDDWENLRYPYENYTLSIERDMKYEPYKEFSGDTPTLFRSNLFMIKDDNGHAYACELFTTNELKHIVILMYPAQTELFDGYSNGDLGIGMINQYYYNKNDGVRVAMLENDDTDMINYVSTANTVLYRAHNAVNDIFSYIYTEGIDIH